MPPVLRTTLPPLSPRVSLTTSSSPSLIRPPNKAPYHHPSASRDRENNNNNANSSSMTSSSSVYNNPEDASLLEQDPTPEHLQIQADTDLADSNDYEDSATRRDCSNSNISNSNGSSIDIYDTDPTIAPYSSQQQLDPRLLRMKSCPQLTTTNGSNNNKASTSSSTSSSSFGNVVFWKGRKVSSTDIASVGNASDTDVRLDGGQQGGDANGTGGGAAISASGRALHENAKLALNRKDYKTALALFEAILTAQVNRFGPCHASVAAAMHNVGVCRQRMNQNALAENLLAEAVQIRKQTLGREHLDVAASLSKLGSVRVALGRFDEAFDDLRAALNIAKSPGVTRGDRPNHKTIAQMQCHLACLYFEKGELLAAQATFQDALAIFRMLWAQRKDQDTATRNALAMQLTDTLCNIGSVQNRRKRFSEAIASFQEALDLQRGIMLSQDDPRIISTLDNLGYSYSKNKEYARAVTCYKSMLRSQVSHSGTFSTDCLATFRKRILLYEKLKLPEQALEDTKEVLRLQKSMLPKDHVIVMETKSILEELNQKKYKKRKEQEHKKQAAVAAGASNPAV